MSRAVLAYTDASPDKESIGSHVSFRVSIATSSSQQSRNRYPRGESNL